MAEAITHTGQAGHEDDINYLDIDFDDAAVPVAANNDNDAAGTDQGNEAAADEFDFQLEEFEVVDDQGNAAPSLDLGHDELAVPQHNTAESEIGYEDEEALKDNAGSHDIGPADYQQDQNQDEAIGSTDNVDEIDYEDGDFDATHDDDTMTQARPGLESSLRQEAAAQVLTQQVLDNTVANADPTQDSLDADDRSVQEHSAAGQQVSGEDNSVSAADGDYPDGSVSGAAASDVSDVMVLYNGILYELCASVHNEDPETYFFAGSQELDVPLSQFFVLLRDVIKDEIEPSDDLVIIVTPLKLEFGEDSSPAFLDKFTFRNILDLYHQLKYNDGQEDAKQPQLVMELVARPNCLERFSTLLEAAAAGRGWKELFQNSDGSDNSDMSSGHETDQVTDQQEYGSEEEQVEGTDDDIPHEAAVASEEAYFYNDTNAPGDHDADHMFDDPEADYPEQYHAGGVDNQNEVYGLASGLIENDEFDQVPERFDDHMDHMEGDYDAAADHVKSPILDADGSDEHESTSAGTGLEGTDEPTDGGEVEGFNEEAGSGLEASDPLASGNQSLPFRTLGDPVPGREQEWIDELLNLDRGEVTPEMWKKFYELPVSPATRQSGGPAGEDEDEDLIDYSDPEIPPPQTAQCMSHFTTPTHSPCHCKNCTKPESGADDQAEDDLIDYEQDDVGAPSLGTEHDIMPSIERDEDVWSDGSVPSAFSAQETTSPVKPPSVPSQRVCRYRLVGTGGDRSRHANATQQPRSSISPRMAALMMAPRVAVQSPSPFSSHSPPAYSSFTDSSSNRSQSNGANWSGAQVYADSASPAHAGVEAAHESAAHDELDDDYTAPNDFATDHEGFAESTSDDVTNNEQLAVEAHDQVSGSHNTSATSTINGDEITYEDDDVAHVDAETENYEVEGDATHNLDEIDWENDEAGDVAIGQDLTNPSSPSGLSVKRGREADDLTGLDEESDAKRRKI